MSRSRPQIPSLNNIFNYSRHLTNTRSPDMPHIVLRWDAESDGDPTHKPTAATVYRPADPEHELLYRQKLAQQLMVESDRAEKGKQAFQHLLYAHSQLSSSISMILRLRWYDHMSFGALRAVSDRWWAKYESCLLTIRDRTHLIVKT